MKASAHPWPPSSCNQSASAPGTEMRLGSGAPSPDWWQQRCDYVIDAAIDPEARRLEASMTVTYHNNSPHELDFVWLQLEQCA